MHYCCPMEIAMIDLPAFPRAVGIHGPVDQADKAVACQRPRQTENGDPYDDKQADRSVSQKAVGGVSGDLRNDRGLGFIIRRTISWT